jgi:hypothetical protein
MGNKHKNSKPLRRMNLNKNEKRDGTVIVTRTRHRQTQDRDREMTTGDKERTRGEISGLTSSFPR